MNFDKKFNNKFFRFFEWLFLLVVINILTVLSSILVITFFPAIVAAYKTIKDAVDEGPKYVIKPYFRNFFKYSEKAFLIGLVIILVIGVASIGVWYYYPLIDSGIYYQMGFIVMIFIIFLMILLTQHIPLLLITFPQLKVVEIIKTSVYVSFRYLWLTIILLLLTCVMVFGIWAYPVWVFIGISGPLLLSIIICKKLYQELVEVDLSKVFSYVENDELDKEGNIDNE